MGGFLGVLLAGLPDREHDLLRHHGLLRIKPCDQRLSVGDGIPGHAGGVDGDEQQLAGILVGFSAGDADHIGA